MSQSVPRRHSGGISREGGFGHKGSCSLICAPLRYLESVRGGFLLFRDHVSSSLSRSRFPGQTAENDVRLAWFNLYLDHPTIPAGSTCATLCVPSRTKYQLQAAGSDISIIECNHHPNNEILFRFSIVALSHRHQELLYTSSGTATPPPPLALDNNHFSAGPVGFRVVTELQRRWWGGFAPLTLTLKSCFDLKLHIKAALVSVRIAGCDCGYDDGVTPDL
jgi:hypothetical protein